MRGFVNRNPIVIAMYFLCAIGIAIICNNPFINSSLFAFGIITYIAYNCNVQLKDAVFTLSAFLVISIINPLVSHKGESVLFFINNKPITKEAVLFGINSALLILGVFYWGKLFWKFMPSEKVLYCVGKILPKLALILSMTLYNISVIRKQISKVEAAQKAIGLYKENNIYNTILSKTKIYSIIITWILENGIITAESMEGRGYGKNTRTCISNFRFDLKDKILLFAFAIFSCYIICSHSNNYIISQFYPCYTCTIVDFKGKIALILYAAFLLYPLSSKIGVDLYWKFLRSKI